MTKLSICLAKLNSEGLSAEIVDEDTDGQLEVYSEYVTDDVEFVCRHSARQLRLLADAFDCLATMDNPCSYKTQALAMAAAKQAQHS